MIEIKEYRKLDILSQKIVSLFQKYDLYNR
jgi:hypothetical protein